MMKGACIVWNHLPRISWLKSLFIIFALCLPLSASDPGDPGRLLDFGAGARSLGMGTAYTAIAQDATAAYWNPAGLAAVTRHEFNLLHAALYGGATYDFAGYGGYRAGDGVLGAYLARLSIDGADLRDANNNLLGSFGYSETALGAGYGMIIPALPTLSVGTSAHTLLRTLQGSSDQLSGLDIGGQYAMTSTLELGLMCRNVLRLSQGDTDDKLPQEFRLGVGYQAVKGLTLSADLENFTNVILGAEYAFSIVSLRVGMLDNSPTFGMGLRWKDLTFDMAFASNSDLGTSSRFSLGYAFGKTKNAGNNFVINPEFSVAELLDRSATAIDRGYYTEAELLLHTAHRVKRDDEKVRDLLDRVGVITPYVHSVAGWDRSSKMARAGINSYLKGDTIDGLWFLTYAASLDKNQVGLNRIIDEISRLSGYHVEYKPGSPLTLTQQVLGQALTEFRSQRYDEAVSLCQRVISLEPNNGLAYKRMGSALYALHQYEAAMTAWHRALAFETDEKSKDQLLQFIDMARKSAGGTIDLPVSEDNQDELEIDDVNTNR
jgi:hypothetical protein